LLTAEEKARRSPRYLVSHWHPEALGVDGIPARVWQGRQLHLEPTLFYIVDGGREGEDYDFVLRNFGVLSPVVSMKEAFRDVPHTEVSLDPVKTGEILTSLSAETRRPITPLQLCRMFARLGVATEYDPLGNTFHIGCGDHALDFLYAWNRGWLGPGWISFSSLWLSSAKTNDPRFMEGAAKAVQHLYWANEGQKRVRLVSYSMEQPRLEEIAQQWRGWLHLPITAHRLTPEEFPSPKPEGRNSRMALGSPLEDLPTVTTQVPFSESAGLVSTPLPPYRPIAQSQQGWMVDLDLQFHPDRYQHTNSRPTWQLPRRSGLGWLFFRGSAFSRIAPGGQPSCQVTVKDPALQVHIPSDREVVTACLAPHLLRGWSIGDPEAN